MGCRKIIKRSVPTVKRITPCQFPNRFTTTCERSPTSWADESYKAIRRFKRQMILYHPGSPRCFESRSCQSVAAMGLAKKWEREHSAAVIAECGTGKSLISLAGIHVHSNGRPFTAVVMAPGHITLKWCKEALQTMPRLRVFLIDALRDRVREGTPCGVNEVKLRHGKLYERDCTLASTDLRLRKNYRTARDRWQQRSARDLRFL